MGNLLTLIFYPFVWAWTLFENIYSWVFYNHENWGVFHTGNQWVAGFFLLIPLIIPWAIAIMIIGEET